jgi:hypothetical protein
VRLHIAVHDAVLVRERKPARYLMDECKRLVDRQLPLAVDELLEVLTLDVLEDDELPPLELAAVDDRDDVRMVQLRERPCLTAETLDVLRVIRVVVVQDLDRDRALEQVSRAL